MKQYIFENFKNNSQAFTTHFTIDITGWDMSAKSLFVKGKP